VKTTLVLTANSCDDNNVVMEAVRSAYGTVSGAGVTSTLPVPTYCAVRNFRTSVMMKNVSTYQLRFTVTTWVCRQEARFGGGAYTNINQLIIQGYTPPWTSLPPTHNTPGATDISGNLFQNPLWVHHFKAIKVKKYTLMPYRTRNEVLHTHRRKPGYLWLYGNAGSGDGGTTQAMMLCRKDGGVTTCIKTIEIVGEITNDDEIYPDTGVATSAGVLIIQNKIEFEAAASQNAVQFFSIGDPNVVPGTGVTLTGQPWNYMFPTPGATSSFGSSSVVGALTSGR